MKSRIVGDGKEGRTYAHAESAAKVIENDPRARISRVIHRSVLVVCT
jgi:hypothetical protein